MPTLGWYLRRARAMSPAELGWRGASAIRKARWRRLWKQGALPTPPAPAIPPPGAPWPHTGSRAEGEIAALIAEANAALNHEWHFLGLNGVREPSIDWHRDPASGIAAPQTFGFDIDHRDSLCVGNIKLTWERSRHHHFTVLAAAYALTKDERYSGELDRQWVGWIRENPVFTGVHWTHPLEHGVRLLAWVWCERLLRGSPHHESLFGAAGPVWDSVYHHQWFIRHMASRGSSANNHLVGEMAGLLTAALAWPVYPESEAWAEFARDRLETAALDQTYPSGLNREQAFGYHLFTTELLVAAAWEAEQACVPLSAKPLQRIRLMLEAISDMADRGGNLPAYGDGDDGIALKLGPQTAPRQQWLFHVGRSLTGADVPIGEDGNLASALMGREGPARTVLSSRATQSQAWEDAGFYVLTSRRDRPDEVFVLADAGPHGYLSIAAHAHADALSCTLSAGGVPILVDAGTFTYHTQGVWRDRFRGTGLHNTVRVDDRDQAQPTGTFLWSRHPRTRVTEWTPSHAGGRLSAWHDGFRDLGVLHRRTFSLDDQTLTLTDTLEGSGSHQVELRFLFHPACELDTRTAHQVRCRSGSRIVSLTLPPLFAIQPARGGEGAGWYSPAFGVRLPAWQVIARAECTLPVHLESILTVASPTASEEPNCR